MIQRKVMEFILERIHRAWQIQGCVCADSGAVLAMAANNSENVYQVSPDAALIKELYEKCQASSLPVVSM